MLRPSILTLVLACAIATPSLAAEGKGSNAHGYAQFPTLTATLTHADGRRGVLTLEAGVDAHDPALRQRLDQMRPRLRDAWTSTIQRFAMEMAPGAAPDVDALARRLQADTDRVLGRPGARFLVGSCIIN